MNKTETNDLVLKNNSPKSKADDLVQKEKLSKPKADDLVQKEKLSKPKADDLVQKENSLLREIKVIGYIFNDFNEKFGIPRQSGLLENMLSVIKLEKEFSFPEAFRGIEEFSHLWLLWEFSENKTEKFSPTVRPPRLGGNKRVGVFATRSPFRPNNMGLSSVKLEEVKIVSGQVQLIVSGADILSGTPIFDIKPYIKYTDCHENAVSGFADRFVDYALTVIFPENLLNKIEKSKQSTVVELLQQDPRPSYQEDKYRIYSVSFGKYDIKFSVCGDTLTVKEVNFSC